MEKKLNQKDAVYFAVKSALGDLYSKDEPMRQHFPEPTYNPYQLKSEDYKDGILNESIQLLRKLVENGHLQYPGKLYEFDKKYYRKLIYNWLNKDQRLNGNKEYKPVSRTSEDYLVRQYLSNSELDYESLKSLEQDEVINSLFVCLSKIDHNDFVFKKIKLQILSEISNRITKKEKMNNLIKQWTKERKKKAG